jgi:hypothetical protein
LISTYFDVRISPDTDLGIAGTWDLAAKAFSATNKGENMKHVKTLGFAALAASALIAILGVGTASATTLTKEAGATVKTNSTIHANLESGTVAKLIFGIETVECSEATIGAITGNETGVAITSSMTSKTLSFNKCNCEVKTLAGNFFIVEWIKNTSNGTLTSSGAEITTSCTTEFGLVHCRQQQHENHSDNGHRERCDRASEHRCALR